MEQPHFFRTDLTGQQVPISWREMHEVRRDILVYFEDNLNEEMNVLVLAEYSALNYAQYLSVSIGEEVEESERYAWLCERGSLALLNGMLLDVLTEPLWEGRDLWDMGKDLAQSSLPYLKSYKPNESNLETGREFLINAMEFTSQMSADDLDINGEVNFPVRTQAAWFTKNIIGDYFRSTAMLDFG